MAFSIAGILSVLLEVLRPLLPFFIALLIIDAILLIVALKRGTLMTSGAIRLAVLLGAIGAVVAFFIGPVFTQASFASLTGALDWLSLIGGSLGVGLLVALLTWPPSAILQRS